MEIQVGDWVHYKTKAGTEFIGIVGSRGQCGVSIGLLRKCMKALNLTILEVRREASHGA